MNEKQRKALMEKRAALIDEMTTLTNKVAEETRAFTEEEQKDFDAKAKEVKDIDATLSADEQTRAFQTPESSQKKESQEELDIRAFANIIRGVDQNITKSDNGAVIPTTIAKKIIDRIYDISPVFGQAEKFNVKGNVAIPYVDAANDNITVAYADEFTDLEAKSTKLLTVNLTGFLAGALAKISKSLLNSTDLDLTNFVIEKIAQAAALFIDGEVLVGTPGGITGLSTMQSGRKVTSAAAAAISMDDVISLKSKLKSAFQKNAFFVMHPDTLDMLRHLKDDMGRYYVLDDVTKDFGTTLLGKPVYTSDQMPQVAAGNTSIYYGDFRQGLGAKVVEDSVQVLTEKYATQHALGIVAWLELDCKIQNQQAVAALVQKSGASA
jgi:HK97 family phage major capsid protein